MARLRYPTGVRPLLIEETARRRRAESRVVSVLKREGFDEVVLPIIDYAEPYGTGEIEARTTYRFIDRDGELVAIRSDFTPLVARALAPSITAETLPLRVFYRGDVIRYEASRLGANREIFQIGAEIVGDETVQADIAVLRLVSEVIRALGIEPLIVYSDATIPERLGDADGSLRQALAEKGPAAGTAIELGAIPGLRDIAERLALIEAAQIPGCVLHPDDVDRVRGYYTGFRFRAYDAASRGVIVARGGRYDSLYSRFGNAAPAAGFTLTISDTR